MEHMVDFERRLWIADNEISMHLSDITIAGLLNRPPLDSPILVHMNRAFHRSFQDYPGTLQNKLLPVLKRSYELEFICSSRDLSVAEKRECRELGQKLAALGRDDYDSTLHNDRMTSKPPQFEGPRFPIRRRLWRILQRRGVGWKRCSESEKKRLEQWMTRNDALFCDRPEEHVVRYFHFELVENWNLELVLTFWFALEENPHGSLIYRKEVFPLLLALTQA